MRVRGVFIGNQKSLVLYDLSPSGHGNGETRSLEVDSDVAVKVIESVREAIAPKSTSALESAIAKIVQSALEKEATVSS